MDNPIDPRLTRRIERANTFMRAGLIVAVLANTLGLIVVIAMLVVIQQTEESNLAISRDMAAQNHKRTQEYVKCVATTLTIPLRDRDKDAVERCADAALEDTKEADKYGK